MEPKKPTTYSRGWSTQSKSSKTDTRHRLSFSKRTITIAVILLVVIIAGSIVIGILVSHANSSKNAATTTSQSKIVTPTFQTITPNGESASQLGGWERVSPPKSAPVFAYADTVGGVLISVSEQQLPASFTANTDSQIAELATAYNATDIVTAGSTKVYIGTSAKGPQSVIFTKSGLLILIKSEKVIPDTAWAKYATSLS